MSKSHNEDSTHEIKHAWGEIHRIAAVAHSNYLHFNSRLRGINSVHDTEVHRRYCERNTKLLESLKVLEPNILEYKNPRVLNKVAKDNENLLEFTPCGLILQKGDEIVIYIVEEGKEEEEVEVLHVRKLTTVIVGENRVILRLLEAEKDLAAISKPDMLAVISRDTDTRYFFTPDYNIPQTELVDELTSYELEVEKID